MLPYSSLEFKADRINHFVSKRENSVHAISWFTTTTTTTITTTTPTTTTAATITTTATATNTTTK